MSEIMTQNHEQEMLVKPQETMVVHDLDDTHIDTNALVGTFLDSLVATGNITKQYKMKCLEMIQETRGQAVDLIQYLERSAEGIPSQSAQDWVDQLCAPRTGQSEEERITELHEALIVEGSPELINELQEAGYQQMFLTYGGKFTQSVKLLLWKKLTGQNLPARILVNHEENGRQPDKQEKAEVVDACYDQVTDTYTVRMLTDDIAIDAEKVRRVIILDDKEKNLPLQQNTRCVGLLVRIHEGKDEHGFSLQEARELLRYGESPFGQPRQ